MDVTSSWGSPTSFKTGVVPLTPQSIELPAGVARGGTGHQLLRMNALVEESSSCFPCAPIIIVQSRESLGLVLTSKPSRFLGEASRRTVWG
jgi:hypothetical protein